MNSDQPTTDRPTIAFIGLGIMGGPMAANLVAAGYQVTGYNRSPGKIATLVDRGGRAADSVADAVTGADVIVTMVPDSPDVEAVAAGPGGIFEHAKPGSIWIDCSTIRPDVAVALAEQAAGSICTTRTWASFLLPPGRPASRSPWAPRPRN